MFRADLKFQLMALLSLAVLSMTVRSEPFVVVGGSTLDSAIEGNNGVTTNNYTVNSGATAVADDEIYIESAASGTININTLNAATTEIGITGGTNNLNGTTTITGTTSIVGSTSISGTTNTVTGATNINTTGSYATSIGSSSNSGAVSIQSTTSASMTVTNSSNETHGLTVGTSATTLSGGTSSTTLQLNDFGATFMNSATGDPSRVTGIADGIDDYDAVNRRQLNLAYAGIASVAALSALPTPAPGKHFSIGVGGGYYEGEGGVAMGMRGSLYENTQFMVGASWNTASAAPVVNGAVGLSW